MTAKQEFLDQLRAGLAGLPQADIEERLAFYSEMIDDRIEEGLTEADAVSQIGPVNDVVSQIIDDIPLSRIVKEKITPRKKMPAWGIILIILGSPIWLPISLVILSVLFVIYAVLWAVIAVLWAVDLAFIVSGSCGIIAGIIGICSGIGIPGIAAIGSGLLLAGLSIFMFFVCLLASRGLLALTRVTAKGIKTLFLRKESAQ